MPGGGGKRFVPSEGTERILRFLWKKESTYPAQEFPFQCTSTVYCLSFWTVSLSGRKPMAFQKRPTSLMLSPGEYSPSKLNSSTQKFFEELVNPHVRCQILNRNCLKGKRWEANTVKTESHRKAKEGGREGTDLVLPLYRNCFDTVSLLHEFSICLCQIHLLQATELSDARFLWCAYVAGQPFCWISQFLTKPGSATQKDVCALLAKSLNFAAEASWQSKPLYFGT